MIEYKIDPYTQEQQSIIQEKLQDLTEKEKPGKNNSLNPSLQHSYTSSQSDLFVLEYSEGFKIKMR